MFDDNPIMFCIYWAALKYNGSLQEWAEVMRRMRGQDLHYPIKEAVEIIEEYGM